MSAREARRWKPYGATTVERYHCDFCGCSSRRNLVGWFYRGIDGGTHRWTQRICGACATPTLPGPTEKLHRSASAS